MDLSVPRIMGILNVTPDSFSDGGDFFLFDAALRHAEQMLAEGADIIDVGGESTRPGSASVPTDEELRRVIPVIDAIVRRFGALVSVDTSKPEVMRAAADVGAGMINDVRALQADGALDAARYAEVPICLMHMQGQPRTMQHDPRYDDVMTDIKRFFHQRISACAEAGIQQNRLLIDPGFGFGKTLAHNLQILGNLHRFVDLCAPIVVGFSRKSMLGALTGRAPGDRLAASLGAALLAVQRGAAIVRVHDVAPTVDVLSVLRAIADSDAGIAQAQHVEQHSTPM